jgi:two-component system response regulator HydG
MPGVTTIAVEPSPNSQARVDEGQVTTLVIAWSADEPNRIGEVAVIPDEGSEQVLGRGDDDVGLPRLRFFRQRPGAVLSTPPLTGAGLSRKQLLVRPAAGGIDIESVGLSDLRVNGVSCARTTIGHGDTIHLYRQLVLLCVRRAPLIPGPRHFPREAWGEFGDADAHGMVGESPTAWLLRERLAFVAHAGTHTLLTGESGTGKELAARAVHAMSSRASTTFVARNAATLPTGLIDAELFGNVKNYPNAGMPERPGLIGRADSGMLFLDEIAELPQEMQAHLLRVLDAGGEYQRLGDAATRRSSFVLVGATNRDPSALKHDLLARLTSRVEIAPLAERREDVPLLVRHLVMTAAARNPRVASRFVGRDAKGRAFAKTSPSFVEEIVGRELAGNTRELDAVLWQAMGEAYGDEMMLPPQNARRTKPSAPSARDESHTPRAAEPTKGEIEVALAESAGSVVRAAEKLGVTTRYALYRLMKKHGIDGRSE